MLDIIIEGLLDTVKLLPYLLLTFIILEILEHKMNNKSEKILKTNKKLGPLFGGILGALPQCGFSTMASNLYSSKVITIGTLIAVFLSTSDEMLPIMISHKTNIVLLLEIVLFKVIVGIIFGYTIDLFYRRKNNKIESDITHMCQSEHCDCDSSGVVVSSIKHTLKIGLFILIANVLIGLFIYKIGEENLSKILLSKNILTYFACSLIGLIPNCASSVIMSELFLSNLITIGNLLSGLLTGSGIGLLILFKTNKNIKENLKVLSIIYFIGVIIGIIVDFVI